jgi:hypothetical protein
MEIVIKETKELAEIQNLVSPIVQRAAEIIIQSETDLELAKNCINQDKQVRNRIVEYWEDEKKTALALHKKIVAKEKEMLTPIDEARKIYDQKIGLYMDEVERKAKEEAEKETERIRKEQEKVLAKINKTLEKLQNEQKGLQEQIDELNRMLTETQDETEIQIITSRIESLTAMLQKKVEKVEDIQTKIEETAMPETPQPEIELPKVAGMSTGKTLVPEVVNAMAVIKAVASGSVPTSIIKFDIVMMKRLINGGMMIPGTRVTTQRTIKTRS